MTDDEDQDQEWVQLGMSLHPETKHKLQTQLYAEFAEPDDKPEKRELYEAVIRTALSRPSMISYELRKVRKE